MGLSVSGAKTDIGGEGAPLLACDGVWRSFLTPAGPLEVLRGVSMELSAAEIVAVVGPSGSGKSTLLHVLGALDPPCSGTVRLDGRDVYRMSERESCGLRNRTLGFVFQFHHLLPEFTALENVMMPALIQGLDREEAEPIAAALLGQVGLGGRMGHRPSELSGGEQQRVAVARALVNRPRVVLTDEPSGNLDAAQGRELFGLLEGFRESSGQAFLVVTHNMELARAADRILRLEEGRVVPTEVSQ